ncbi:hypothetical protein ACLBX9_16630 [Methylobacterium sp. A49B]
MLRVGMAVALVGCATVVRAAMPGELQTEMIACESRDLMVRALELIDQKDNAAADELWRRGRLAGSCRVFYKGDKIILEVREMTSGLSKIHKPGEPSAYWIVNYAVDPRR